MLHDDVLHHDLNLNWSQLSWFFTGRCLVEMDFPLRNANLTRREVRSLNQTRLIQNILKNIIKIKGLTQQLPPSDILTLIFGGIEDLPYLYGWNDFVPLESMTFSIWSE